jgi:hypothetical protein
MVRVEFGKARCRFHGGLSTGPKTEAGRGRIAAAQRRRWRLTRPLRLSGQGCRGMGWRPSVSPAFYSYLVICIGDVTGVTEKWIATSLLPSAILHNEAGVQFFDGPRRREAASHPCAGSAEEETSRAVPRFLGITQRVPIAVVVGLTGKHFGFVMFAFFSVRFGSGNARRDILCW